MVHPPTGSRPAHPPDADPFRWLEETTAERTREWVAAQDRRAAAWLTAVPERPALVRRVSELWDHERFGLPVERGGRYFFTYNSGLEDQTSLYVLDHLDGEPRRLIDAGRLSADGTVALAGWAPSEDGRLLAYGLSHGGSDWTDWRVRDVATGRDLPDVVRWAKFTGAVWTADGEGFIYGRYDVPRPGEELAGVTHHQKLCYHRLGTSQDDDRVIFERPEHPDWGYTPRLGADGRYLVIQVWPGTDRRNRIYLADLSRPGWPVVPLIDRFDANYEYVDNQGPLFWLITDRDAPRGRMVAVDLERREPASWREVIPESRETLRLARAVGDRLLAVYLSDARTRLRLFDRRGRHERELALPGLGTVDELAGRRTSPEAFFCYTDATDPGTIFRYDAGSGRCHAFRRPVVACDREELVTRQVFYRSADGTRVPMYLFHRGDLPPGPHPTLLVGYGGFRICMTPRFSATHLAWMELGGVLAVANIRGGGEYGQEWYEAGRRRRKQTSFDDFLAAARWLAEEGVTTPERLAICGRSNGGLLVGAALTQRPDLFGAALVHVGVLDMLRFHKFTVGWAWVSDYGSPEDPEDRAVLRRYSPYHNVVPGTEYPATLVTTADHDDRVVPVHSYKFAAALQEAQAGDAPILLRVGRRAGHGPGKPTSKQIEEAADVLAFLVRVLEVRPADPRGAAPSLGHLRLVPERRPDPGTPLAPRAPGDGPEW